MKRKTTAVLFLAAFFLCLPISGEAEEVLTHAEYIDAETDSYVTVETYVQDKFVYYSDGTASLFAQSEDGAYYIYRAEMDEETYEALTPGMKIRVSGYKSLWSGENELVDGEIEVIDDGDTYLAEPVDVSSLLLSDELYYYQNSLVVFNDMTIQLSEDPDGNLVPFLYAWDGTGREGDDLYFYASYMGCEFTFVVESDLCDADSDVYQKVKGLEDGESVTLEGYLYYYEGPCMMVTDVTDSDDIKSTAAAANKAIEDAANEIREEIGSSGSRSTGSSGSSGSSSSGSSRRSSSSGSSSSGSSAEPDPYNAEDYDDPELFYDDNYLDFDSFEDAEVYWDDFQ